MPRPLALAALLSLLAPARPADACTSILVAPSASADGSSMITYAADSHELYGDLQMTPARKNRPGAMRPIVEWDTGTVRGEIPEARETYSVVGNMNERQVAIAETTFGGRLELVDPTGLLDYGSLIYIGLERAATAREAITVITSLVAEYGYASEGESLSISDPREVWLLEIIGKGPGNKGAVWVARKVPDGMITAHANQSRIRRFLPADAKSTLYAKDVVSFAREKGWFKGADAEFSFADAYAPLDSGSLRFCEARVWNVFRRAAPSANLSPDFVLGVPGAAPLPLFIKPDKKLAAGDVIELMRDHFEGTPLDMSKDVGAGPYHAPYRWRPMEWEVDGKKYLHERAISTQQTGWSMVAQGRGWLPDVIGGVLWFGVDDTYLTVYIPLHVGILRAPAAYAQGVATLTRFSWDSAFWVFNWVANTTYARWEDMVKDVRRAQNELEGEFQASLASVDSAALELHRRAPGLARDYLTEIADDQAARTVARWRRLGEELLVKYLDGNVKDEHGAVTHPPYPEDWYRRIVADTGERVRLLPLPGQIEPDTSVARVGYFHSRAELGDLAARVPADFPFAAEKLLLLPGDDRCARPPECCLGATPDGKGRLVVTAPKTEGKCGRPRWLVRVPVDEARQVIEGKAP